MQKPKFAHRIFEFCRKRQNASGRTQTPPNASKCIRTGPKMSERIHKLLKNLRIKKLCKKVEHNQKLRKTCEMSSVTSTYKTSGGLQRRIIP